MNFILTFGSVWLCSGGCGIVLITRWFRKELDNEVYD